MKIIKQLELPNGLILRFVNNSRRYFGDYHQVNVDAVCDVPVRPDHEAASLLGESAVFRRTLTRMGVPSAGMEEAIDQLLSDFEKNSLAYLCSPSFAEKFIRSEMLKCSKKRILPSGGPRF